MSNEKRWESKGDPAVRRGHFGIGFELYVGHLASQREDAADKARKSRGFLQGLGGPCRCVIQQEVES